MKEPMKPWTHSAVALGTLCLTWVASAVADVQVSYTVNDRALRAAVTGTSLTFQLYSDSGCTMAVGSPVAVNIENVALIERLKRFVPSGSTRPPATDRLTHVLAGATGSSPTFLKVTGTGIMAVGGACQLQFATNTGTGLPCASQLGNEVFFTGCNVNVRSGSGSTTGAVNGLGNLIVGYNANTGGHTRTGSHNLIVGDEHTYSSYGGLVAGDNNAVTAPFASVSGGAHNIADGDDASVSGGENNEASGTGASVSGGKNNLASGTGASVSGGSINTASNQYASVSGGENNTASGTGASVSGGALNMASGLIASVSGGSVNTASNQDASVSGGENNLASGRGASVSGGALNMASGPGASVSGGNVNIASGSDASVSGGEAIEACVSNVLAEA